MHKMDMPYMHGVSEYTCICNQCSLKMGHSGSCLLTLYRIFFSETQNLNLLSKTAFQAHEFPHALNRVFLKAWGK